MESFNWIVSQLGAREHYLAPRAFHRKGHLDVLLTDAWLRRGAAAARGLPKPVSAAASRYHPELPADKVISFTPGALLRQAARRLWPARTKAQEWDRYLEEGRWFASRVNRRLRGRRLDPRRHQFFGYKTGALATLKLMRERGVVTVLDQLDPGGRDIEAINAELEKWPGWAERPGQIPQSFWDYMAEESAAAEVVLVNSRWSRDAMIDEGVPAEKLVVVPLAYEPEEPAERSAARRPADSSRPLLVLWLGGITLRKGIPYLFEAARALHASGEDVRFVVAGPVDVPADKLAGAPPNLEVLGRVPRRRALELYAQSDVFVLPTLSDGFALTQIEAMSFGLPVVATPNCGDVVTDGVDGLIVPPADSDALARAIAALAADRSRVSDMSRHALVKSKQFTVEAFAARVEAAVVAREKAAGR
jgi:glycosyltransferase involved in cell wall biosynthesis